MPENNSTTSASLVWILASVVLVGAVFGVGGYLIGKGSAPEERPAPSLAAADKSATPPPAPKPEKKQDPIVIDPDDRDGGSGDGGRARGPFGQSWEDDELSDAERKELEERGKRWESMPVEQRQMVQRAWMKAFVSNMQEVQELGEAVRKGDLDEGVVKELMNPKRFMERLDEVEVLSDLGTESDVQSRIGEMMRADIETAKAAVRPKTGAGAGGQ